MTKDKNEHISEPVDLSRAVYTEGSDFQLLCCQVGHMNAQWVSAAEIVYEMTGKPGSVVRNTITFELDKKSAIDIDLLDGSFQVIKDGKSIGKGRKGIELLMAWKSMSFDEALDWVASKYSFESAEVMANDFVNMKMRSLSKRLGKKAAD